MLYVLGLPNEGSQINRVDFEIFALHVKWHSFILFKTASQKQLISSKLERKSLVPLLDFFYFFPSALVDLLCVSPSPASFDLTLLQLLHLSLSLSNIPVGDVRMPTEVIDQSSRVVGLNSYYSYLIHSWNMWSQFAVSTSWKTPIVSCMLAMEENDATDKQAEMVFGQGCGIRDRRGETNEWKLE